MIVARVGRYGPFVERGTDRASIPEDVAPDELTVTKATELLESRGKGDKILGTDPGTGLIVLGRPAGSARTSSWAKMTAGSRSGRASSRAWTSTRSPSTTPSASSPSPALSAPTPTASKSSPSTAATGRTSNGDQTGGPWGARTSSSRSPSTRPSPSSPSRPGGGRSRRRFDGPGGRLRPGHRQDGHPPQRPLRTVRHRRRGQRLAPQGRRPGVGHHRARLRAPRRPQGTPLTVLA